MVVAKTTKILNPDIFGVSFSGGGIISAAQLGIMKAIDKRIAIKPTVFTGASGGSIVAGLLAAGISIEDALQAFKDASKKILNISYGHIIKGMVEPHSYVDGLILGNQLENVIDQLTGYKRLAEISNQLAIPATDIDYGDEVIFTNADHEKINKAAIKSNNYFIFPNSYERLAHVIHASCSFPGVFVPTQIAGHKLSDAGITNNLPSDLAVALGATKVISIDLGYTGGTTTQGIYDILNMSLHIMARRNVEDNKDSCGLYLDPKIYDVYFLDTSRIQEVFDRGYSYANDNMDKIKDYLSK